MVGLGTRRRLEAAAGRSRELIEVAITAGIRLFDTYPCTGPPRGCWPTRWGHRDQVMRSFTLLSERPTSRMRSS